MTTPRPFRFGGSAPITPTGAEYAEHARRIEALGYATFLLPDHFSPHWFAAGPALTAAALATTTLRVGCTVYDNDFRHPALLAREAATIDVLSGGRMELGIGAGWLKPEYDQVGIRFDPPPVRVSRLEEGVRIIKGLWGDGAFSFAGEHYTISGLEGWPKPLQHPRPPIHIGAGGRRMLASAAREADSIGIIAQALPGGGLDRAADSDALLTRKIGWVREAAGGRFDRIELAMLIWGVAVTDDRETAAARLAAAHRLTVEQVLASPYFLIGSVAQLVEELLALRQRHGISYLSFFPGDTDTFAPVVARLAGR